MEMILQYGLLGARQEFRDSKERGGQPLVRWPEVQKI
jgi:hypothetical protein